MKKKAGDQESHLGVLSIDECSSFRVRVLLFGFIYIYLEDDILKAVAEIWRASCSSTDFETQLRKHEMWWCEVRSSVLQKEVEKKGR